MTGWMDEVRRHMGRGLDAAGLGPQETPHRVVREWPGARLRAYHAREASQGPVLLIIPAPFKQVYIWDLLPPVSVVRRCLERGFRVYLLEWLVPTEREDEFGLAEVCRPPHHGSSRCHSSRDGLVGAHSCRTLPGRHTGGHLCHSSSRPCRQIAAGGRSSGIWRAWRSSRTGRQGPSARRHDPASERQPCARVGDQHPLCCRSPRDLSSPGARWQPVRSETPGEFSFRRGGKEKAQPPSGRDGCQKQADRGSRGGTASPNPRNRARVLPSR